MGIAEILGCGGLADKLHNRTSARLIFKAAIDFGQGARIDCTQTAYVMAATIVIELNRLPMRSE
jgi:hypothetical protein